MYAYIKGEIVDISEDNVILECNNIGYNIKVPFSVVQRLPSIGEDVKKSELSFIAGGNVKWCSHCGRAWWLLKKLNIELQRDLAIPLLISTPKNGN